MFRKILIANRGEIACRVILTARRMGIATVAVWSDADRNALHVSLADEAVRIGPATVEESYLRGDVIIAAAVATGAGAIHPGYGFLSENPEFVEAVEAAGLVFIGPSASSICAMGLKDAAKRLMIDAGVPVVPGYQGADQADGLLSREAATIGYPVLIKAVAGGGGKGMRRVDVASDFALHLASARSEAKSAFGNDAVLIEKWIDRPRHIEMQVFGDGTDAVHLFERDCSLQRRHQKVIEETPAPGMTPEMRSAMGVAAIRAALAVNYRGAGTVEFIVDASDGLRPDRFWFMEMNTRLQVEHPVTEAVTGIDLVEWQIRVAAGEALPLRQDQISLSGHAFEARLYAEDVAAGFLPATGRIAYLSFPEGARADTGVRTGDVISPWYDPMIAKIIVHGSTRAIALQKLDRALVGTRVAGTVTNLGFLGALSRHPGVVAGEVDTGLITRDIDRLLQPEKTAGRALAAAALHLSVAGRGFGELTGFCLWRPLRRPVRLRQGDRDSLAWVTFLSLDRVQIEADELTWLCERRAGEWWIGDGRTPEVIEAGGALHVFDPERGAGVESFGLVDPLDRAAARVGGSDVALAPMPGRITAILVEAGSDVVAGDRLVVLEAMKMEHALIAPRDGVIAEVMTEVGHQVEAGAALVRLEAAA